MTDYLGKAYDYSIKRILSTRDAIIKEFSNEKFAVVGDDNTRFFLEEFLGDAIDKVADMFVPAFNAHLRGSRTVIEQSLRALLADANGGFPLTEDYRRAAWIMAANEHALMLGRPIAPVSNVSAPEWTPVKAMDYSTDSRSGKSDGGSITFLCMGGTLASQTFSKYCVKAFNTIMKLSMFMLPKFKPVSAREMVGMLTWVKLQPGRSVTFSEFFPSKVFQQYNRKLLVERETACPAGFQHECASCYVGLHDCNRAVHSTTYVLQQCPCCGNKAAWFLPAAIGDKDLCIFCTQRKHPKGVGK